MEPEKQAPQHVATLDIVAEGKDKKIDDVDDPIAKAILDLPKESWKTIRSIKLSCNSYGPAVFEKFGEMVEAATEIQVQYSSTQALDITDCFMGRKKEEMGKAIYGIMEPLINGRLVELNLSNNALGTVGARTLTTFLDKLPNLKRFFIANCGLGSIGAKDVLQRIVFCKKLEVLSIGKNRMEVEGGMYLAEALKHFSELKMLLCFQNGIRKSAMENLLESVYKHNKKLEVLDISDNFAYGEAVAKLVTILKDPEFKIKALNLSDCIDKDDLGTIIDALKSGREQPILERFGLNYVELRDPELAERVLQYLERCPLKYLEVQGTELTKKMKKAFEERLEAKVGKLVFKDQENDEAELVNAFGSMKLNEK